jgi:hypothetical protein
VNAGEALGLPRRANLQRLNGVGEQACLSFTSSQKQAMLLAEGAGIKSPARPSLFGNPHAVRQLLRRQLWERIVSKKSIRHLKVPMSNLAQVTATARPRLETTQKYRWVTRSRRNTLDLFQRRTTHSTTQVSARVQEFQRVTRMEERFLTRIECLRGTSS